MDKHFQDVVLEATNATSLSKIEDIQSLWSGYGSISRFALTGGDFDRVVVKHVKLPDQSSHPRGWNTNLSHQRKIKSYHVESTWYENNGSACDESCQIPVCYGTEAKDDQFLMVLEDLDANGFPIRKDQASLDDMQVCLQWLANFHATFMGMKPEGLWDVGTYWHLDTRPDELKALEDERLKAAATKIDQTLNESPYQTFVHGDAKLANFCFSENSQKVAAVDFQYVGGGCGMKDVAYFIGSCLYEDDCERYEKTLLDMYFDALKEALLARNATIDPQAVERDWRKLFAVAWTDFHRFVKGWSPGHWKIHGYSESLSRKVLEELGF